MSERIDLPQEEGSSITRRQFFPALATLIAVTAAACAGCSSDKPKPVDRKPCAVDSVGQAEAIKPGPKAEFRLKKPEPKAVNKTGKGPAKEKARYINDPQKDLLDAIEQFRQHGRAEFRGLKIKSVKNMGAVKTPDASSIRGWNMKVTYINGKQAIVFVKRTEIEKRGGR